MLSFVFRDTYCFYENDSGHLCRYGVYYVVCIQENKSKKAPRAHNFEKWAFESSELKEVENTKRR